MNQTNKKNRSRRSFIKSATQLAVGSTLVGSVETKSAENATPTTSNGGQAATGLGLTPPKPGQHIPHPPGSKFKGQRRVPGFLPSTDVDSGHLLFPEEAISTNLGLNAFPTPNSQGNDFDEPSSTASAQDWNTFNAWMLGGPFTNKGSEFDQLLENLANQVRKYNAALYWMRRLHFYETLTLGHLAKTKPPRNPHGDKDGNVPPSQWNFGTLITAAQANWDTESGNLNYMLNNPGASFDYLLADMIQVNDYIVSMRVVAQPKHGPLNIFELGGSSSSHISISSAFSSH